MKNIICMLCMTWGLSPLLLRAQEIVRLDSCYNWARQNYPMVRQLNLLALTMEYTVENASKAYYPQLTVNGQATYQSDVTQVPVNLPNVQPISKDQYKLYAELSQMLYDGGTVRLQKDMLKAGAELEMQNVEVELYKLKERINQVFFGVLLIDAQIEQSALLKKDMQSGLDRVNASIINGAALQSQADVIQAEMLKVDQQVTALRTGRKAYIDVLKLMTGKNIETATFEKPVLPELLAPSVSIKRPELLYFDNRNKLVDIQRKLVDARMKPRIGLFAQGGYGRPALNMLNNEFDFYYIGGIRLSWSLAGLYTSGYEKALLDVNYRLQEIQRETFLLNTDVSLQQQNSEIRKYEELLKTDEQIIVLRSRISDVTKAQFENGVINAHDYLRELTAEDLARQNRLLHDMQLLMSRYQQKTITGN